MRVSDFLARLSGVRPISTGGHVAICAGHDDKRPSLKVDEGADGRILLSCKAGCPADRIVRAMGLDMRDLMPDREAPPFTRQVQRDPSSIKDNPAPKTPARVIRETRYQITLPDGEVIEHVRQDLEGGGKNFPWRRAGKPGLGGLPVTSVPLFRPGHIDAAPGSPAVVCEGEKAALAAAELRLDAFGTACGASACPSREVLSASLLGRDVILWPDADAPGIGHARKLSEALKGIARSVGQITWGTPDSGDDAADMLARGGDPVRARGLVASADHLWGPRRLRKLSAGIPGAMEGLDRYTAGDFSDKVPTGVQSLDRRMMGGLRKGTFVLLGAPSGNGKTSAAMQIAAYCAEHRGPVLAVTPEMSLAELAEREIIRRSGVEMRRRRHSAPDATKQEAVTAHMHASVAIAQQDLPIYTMTEAASMSEVEEAAASIPGLRLVIVDYAQEIADDNDPRMPRYLQVGDVARRSVKMAQKLDVPVLVCSQVNAVRGKKGEIIDYTFRESEILVHKAAVVMVLGVKWVEVGSQRHVESAEIICRKHRHGPTFTLPVEYSPQTFTISDSVSPDDDDE